MPSLLHQFLPLLDLKLLRETSAPQAEAVAMLPAFLGVDTPVSIWSGDCVFQASAGEVGVHVHVRRGELLGIACHGFFLRATPHNALHSMSNLRGKRE